VPVKFYWASPVLPCHAFAVWFSAMRQEDLLFNHKRRPPRQPQPGEVLFEFPIGPARVHCELRDHGPAAGVEAMFYQDGELLISRRFDPRLDPTRTPRELAIQWGGGGARRARGRQRASRRREGDGGIGARSAGSHTPAAAARPHDFVQNKGAPGCSVIRPVYCLRHA
jgi:hypothetical protein